MFLCDAVESRYNKAAARYAAAMNNDMPDRIPIRFLFEEVAAKYAGYTTQQTACDFRLAFDATRKMARELNVDAAMLNAIWSNYGVGKGASWKYFAVPGVDVDTDSICQFREPGAEEELCMRAGEYDELADDPTAFLLTKWLARYTSRLSPPGGPVTFSHNAALISGAMAYQRYISSFGEYAGKLKYEAGVVSANAGMIKAPFDLLMDKLRGYEGAIMDAYERPEKVLKACEALMPHIVANALGGADPEKLAPITIWAHRGTVPFITPDMFDRIYWPTVKPVFEEIIARGYRVLFYSEGNWERHYDRLMELPAGGIVYHLDRGDPAKLAGTLKRKFAVSGGLPYDVLARGTRADIEASLKRLFNTLAPDGGYMLDATALMMQDIDIDNVRAAIDYTMEHGVYSRASAASARKREPQGNPAPLPGGRRPPGVCIPWEEESRAYRRLSGDVALVKRSWEETDAWAYNYIWTTLLW
jgi:hypothetical protein